MKAVLLAGGFGTRLRPLTLHTPKPIVPIFDRPFLYHQIDLLKRVPEIDEVILSLNYQPERIEAVVGRGEAAGLAVRYLVEPSPLGTGGAVKYAAPHLDGTTIVFNGDVLTEIDLAAVLALHRDRRARATIVLTPVDNPAAYGLVEIDEAGHVRRFVEKPDPGQVTCNTINAGIYVLEPDTFDRIPEGENYSIERRYFPSLVERGETFVAYVDPGYWLDIGTPQKYLQGHCDILDGRCRSGPVGGRPGDTPIVAEDAAIDPRARLTGPCYVGPGATVGPGAEIGPYGVVGRGARVGAGARIRRAILWPETTVGEGAEIVAAVLGARCRVGAEAAIGAGTVLGDDTVLPAHTRATTRPSGQPMTPTINPRIFKAYDVRGLHPTEVTAEAAQAIGRAFVAYLGARRIAVGRDMRIAAPEIAAAFIAGARTQGADVVDYGEIATDMLYYGVARDDLDGGAEITASHNPKEYIGMKLVRRQALPLSGDAGIGDIREMILDDRIPPPAASPGTRAEAELLDAYLEHVLAFIDRTAIEPYRLVLDAGSGMAGRVAPGLFDQLPCRTTRLCFEVDGRFPNHEANPLIEANRRDIVERVIAEQADAGIAWDGDADRCFFIDGDGGFVPGDFITALLAEAFLRKHPGATIVYDVRASHAVRDVVAAYHGTALMNRVGHAFFKTRMRQENAVFGGEVTGHYYFRDNFYADNGFIPALLLLELMSVRGQTLSELLEPLRAKYFISGEINTEMPDMGAVAATIDRLAERHRDADVHRMDGVSVEYDSWHFNVRPSNTEPLIRLNLEATTAAEMAARRDEVLAFIRR